MSEQSVCQIKSIHHDKVSKAIKTMPSENIISGSAEFFKVFGDPTRIRILHAIKENELCVCDISYLLKMSQSSISHQLSILKRERIVKYRKEGKSVFYSLDDAHVKFVLETGTEHILERSAGLF